MCTVMQQNANNNGPFYLNTAKNGLPAKLQTLFSMGYFNDTFIEAKSATKFIKRYFLNEALMFLVFVNVKADC